jgi:glutathione S-transferase
MAIAPFVRQFTIADAAWFDAQPWPRLRTWLAALLNSSLWNGVMQKYPPWHAGEAGVVFQCTVA